MSAATGKLFVVSAPSGAGKSSLVRALLEADPGLAVSISHTTRAPRGQEVDGREYRFVGGEAFAAMVDRGEFLEWAEVHGNRYGSSRSAVEQRLAEGRDVLLEIDWQGALQIKRLVPDAVLVFVLPPSWEELLLRLRGRGEDRPEVIERRMANAREEVGQAASFDYVVVNADFDAARAELAAVVTAERLNYASQRRRQAAVFKALGLD